MSKISNHKKKLENIVVITLFVFVIFNFFYYVLRPLYKTTSLLDYNCAYNAATEILIDPMSLYEVDKEDDFYFTYNMPPISALIMSPISFFERDTSKVLWHTFDFILIILTSFILLLIFKSFFVRIIIVTVIFSFNPIVQSLEWGNIYNWFVFCFVLCLLLLKINDALSNNSEIISNNSKIASNNSKTISNNSKTISNNSKIASNNRKTTSNNSEIASNNSEIDSGDNFKIKSIIQVIIAFFITIPIIFKLFPGLIIIMFLLRRKYFIFFATIFWIIFFNLISIFVSGFEVNFFYYTRGILRAATYPVFPIPNIQSWTGIFYRLFHVNGSVQCWVNLPWLTKLLSYSFSLMFFVIFIIITYKNNKSIYLNFSFCLFSIMMIQSLVWEYALALIFPGIIIIVNEFIKKENIKHLIVALVAISIISLRLPYDHQIFRTGILILFTGIKLYAVFALWLLNLFLLAKKN